MNVHSEDISEIVGASTQERRLSIMTAAVHIFAERGFHGATLPQLAKEAGVGTGTIYRYFESKENLVNEVYRWRKRLLMERLNLPTEATAPSLQARSAFSALWHNLAAFAREEPEAFAFLELHHHGAYLDSKTLELEEQMLRPLVVLTELLSKAGVTKAIPAPALMAVVWGALVGLFKAERLGHLTITEQLVVQTEQAVWDAISQSGA